jgi:predicted glycoside hydrolase/deacetylase ChbG (UPF0249 family)
VRRLVVNADDLGYDPEIDRGILEAHARGLVSSATAMVDTPFAAAALAAAPSSLCVGLHVVLDPARGAGDAAREIRRQLGRFEALRGRPPTHLDSHRHAHARPDLLPAFLEAAAERALPLRSIDPATRRAIRARGIATADHFLGDAALRPCWTVERLAAAIAGLEEGLTELMAHPGYRPARVETSFGVEREEELRALCDPRTARALAGAGAALVSWAEPGAAARPGA